MKTIYSTPIGCDSIRDKAMEIAVDIQIGAKPISVAKTKDGIKVYWEVEPERLKVTTYLYCVGTGYGAVPEGKIFLGTVVDGSFVWHLYY